MQANGGRFQSIRRSTTSHLILDVVKQMQIDFWSQGTEIGFQTLFNCEQCSYRNCFGVSADTQSAGDEYLVSLIRRANLDMFWSREASTIKAQFGRVKETIRRQEAWGRECRSLFPRLGTHSSSDENGMVQAIMILGKSRDTGRNTEYTQFDTIRKLRTTVSNIYTGSAEVRAENGVLKSRKGEVLHIHDDPMQSVFMERFILGLQDRMPHRFQEKYFLVRTCSSWYVETNGG